MGEFHHKHSQSNLFIAVVLNLAITLAQFIGGLVSGSLALLSDALHNLSDSISIVLAWMAGIIARKPRTSRYTFGFQRAEILAAFINALVLIAISVFLVIEAIKRFIHVHEVNTSWMLWLGLLGLAANAISVLILHKDRKENINLRAAYLHLLGDAMTSIAVILGAVAIRIAGWFWLDPLVTILICIYLLVQSWSILKESTGILMQMSPSDLDTGEVGAKIEEIPGIRDVHHIHIWKLNDKKIHFEGHIVLYEDIAISETNKLREEIRKILAAEFDIAHVTLQFEQYKEKGRGYDC